MSKLLITLLLFGLSGITQAQKIRFEYDVAGNQVLRTYCISCASRSSESLQPAAKDAADITDADLQKFFPEDVISYYPNPVRDEMFLKWELINDNKVNTIEVYSLNGQLLKLYKDTANSNSRSISFQDYPVGVYFIHLNYADGDQKSIKIIKE